MAPRCKDEDPSLLERGGLRSITLCHNKALRGNVNMFFIVTETAGDKLSVSEKKEKKVGGVVGIFHHKQRKVQEKTPKQWKRN